MKYQLLFVLIVLAMPGISAAHTVSMNLAFRVGGDKSDTIHVNGTSLLGSQQNEWQFPDMDKKYISSQRGGNVFALVFAGGEFLGINLSTSYSLNSYSMSMKEDEHSNRFIIAFASGAFSNVDDKAKDVEEFRFLSGMFADTIVRSPLSFPLYMRLEYNNIILGNRMLFGGPVKLLIQNTGKSGNLFNVSVGAI